MRIFLLAIFCYTLGIMDDNDIILDKNDGGDVSLGGGVDIVTNNPDIDDIEFETYNDDVLGGGERTPQDQIKILRERLRETVKEKQEYLNGWQRLKADFANLNQLYGTSFCVLWYCCVHELLNEVHMCTYL